MSSRQIDPDLIGPAFQRLTKYHRDRPGCGRRAQELVQPFKEYPPTCPRVQLPAARTSGGPALWDALARRRSVRRYADGSVSLQTLSQLLWSAQGVTEHLRTHLLRTAPSAGALYPIETYIAVNRVEACQPGIYHYNIRNRTLSRLSEGNPGPALARAALDQQMCADAALTFIWTAISGRSTRKYAQRAYRYIYLDAGHIAQNVALAAVGLGLGSCQIGAFLDDEINALLDIDGEEETAVYLTSVGIPA